ncbi:DNA repair protein RAD5 [Frankliniella fusca]|uniref:DNA repair protein RAD5 n=1 Tax=Frankliniella fusca TaxID=407009 RepID=A0AAE1GXH9_9NEOP|nr:DNA repair protein RAD5 [Frankliniella fusca]
MTQPAPTAWMGPMGPMGMVAMGPAQLWNSPAMWMQPAGGSAAAGAQQPVMMAGPSTSSGRHSKSYRKVPDSSTDDSEEDDVFDHKICRGRPSREQIAGRDRVLREEQTVKNYPPAFEKSDTVALLQQHECRKCQIYLGRVVLKPCGHAKFCHTCVNKLREESMKMKRPAKCPSNEC